MSALKKLSWEAWMTIALFSVIFLIGASVVRNAQSTPNANPPLRVIEYQHDGSKHDHDTVKVVYDHRRIMNLDRNVTELQTKLGSAGWTPVGEVFVKTSAVPSGCVIRVLASEKESSTVQSPYALEGCDPSMSLASILFSPRTTGYSFGTYGYGGYRLATQSR